MYKLLLVDDEAFITDSLAFMLENQTRVPLEVTKAYSAADALAKLDHNMFDMMVSDIDMPGQTGLALARETRAKQPFCKIVFLTGYDDFHYAQQAICYEAVRYVLKNEGDSVLLDAIEACVRRIERDRMRTAPPQAPPRAPDAGKDVLLMISYTKTATEPPVLDAVRGIVLSKINHAVDCEILFLHKKISAWLLQPVPGGSFSHVRMTLKGLAEVIQDAVWRDLGVQIAFVLDEAPVRRAHVQERIGIMQAMIDGRLDALDGVALVGLRFFQNRHDNADEDGESAAFVWHVLKHMRENLGGDLSLTALSDLVYLNPSYLSRHFKEITGYNLTSAILKMRMREACRLLDAGTNKVKNIAALVGYDSAAHFSRIFKRETGLSPQAYRDKMHKVKITQEK